MRTRTYIGAIACSLLSMAACQERPTMETDNVGVGKTIERPETVTAPPQDDDFIQTRSSFEKSLQERLDRVDMRLEQLESRTDAAGHEAAVRLRTMRADIAERLSEVGRQTETGWDRFEADVSRTADELELDLDQLLAY